MRIVLDKNETYVIFAALLAMVEDIHSVQDTMSEENWNRAETLLKKFQEEVENDRAPD